MENSFLYQQAQYLIDNYFDRFNDIVVVLPNKRAKLFLLNHLKVLSTKTFFAPKIISIESLIEDISGLKNLDTIELLFEFYLVYQSIEKNNANTFDEFSGWASTFIQDINEIDRYLINSNKLFQYLVDIDHINQWNVNIENTKLALSTVSFWKKLPAYYNTFRDQLKSKKVGYQGLLYRESVEKLNDFIKNNQKKYLFLGFNALNNAEQIIITSLLENQQAEVHFDIDETFLNDPYHDAGYFLRRIKSSWKHFNNNEFKTISDSFKTQKNIEVISTPKAVGQAKISGKLVEDLLLENSININKTAIVLADENLLLPILNSLPKSVNSLNISMGYPAKNSPVQLLIQKIFKFHLNAKKRKNVIYYKDILNILSNPFFEKILNPNKLIQVIKTNNITFLSAKYFEELFLQNTNDSSDLFNQIFKLDTDSETLLKHLINLLFQIKNSFDLTSEEHKVNLAFIFSIYNLLSKIKNYQQQYQQVDSIEILFSIYKQLINQAEVSFEGEPLTGLQIMGILETRNLDFENLIITSLNEGILPGGKTGNSFIPYDVKKEYDLPTYKERDAIFSYHFYRLLQRAKNIYLIYNNSTDGMDSGEKSRFINQIEYEYQKFHHINHLNYNASLDSSTTVKIKIDKDTLLLNRLKEIATDKGFSPSSMTTYMRNPIQFYFQRILKIYQVEEVEEEIAANTFGTIIHGVLDKMYQPYIGKSITENDIDQLFPLIDEYTKLKFVEEYKEGAFDRGKNLISFEIAKRNIYNFLMYEKEFVAQNNVTIVSLEKEYQGFITQSEFPELPYDVKINGTIDRIDLCNNTLRIIDYKTGKVEQKDISISSFSGLTTQIKNEKIIQLLCYAIMIQNEEFSNYPTHLGIISFKNLSAGFMKLKWEKNDLEIDKDVLKNFKQELVQLIVEILNINVPLTEAL